MIIACPTKFHKEITVAAANAGKHIFCEKPMAMNEEECDEMIEAAEKNHVKLQIGFMRRFDESFQEAKKMIEIGEIGEVVSVKSHTRGPSKPKEWMYDISISNGPLGEVAVMILIQFDGLVEVKLVVYMQLVEIIEIKKSQKNTQIFMIM